VGAALAFSREGVRAYPQITTGANGRFELSELSAGTWNVREHSTRGGQIVGTIEAGDTDAVIRLTPR
jgi:hypothetical protein